MHIGVCIFPTDRSIRPDDLARELEARRFESLFVPEHTHLPTSRRSPFGGEMA
jgi:alkanesulfonate monooxygenase SsuD/methylene tetrahydromethanopterin reductase-like flavin-dependent oxidoreductase (luciferase family)